MRTIPLHGPQAAERVALVDDEDYELVSKYRWYVWEKQRAPGRRKEGPYAVTRTSLSMHKLIIGHPRVDHADGNGLNNQRQNLREATDSQNNANRRAWLSASSQFKGVDRHHGFWRARITIDGECRYLGQFAVEEDAARAYDAAALAAWGDYAHLNFSLQ